MPVSAQQLIQEFPDLLRLVDGDPQKTATSTCSQVQIKPGSISYVSDKDFLAPLLSADIAILVVHEKLSEVAKSQNTKKHTLLASSNTMLAMALVNAKHFALPFVASSFDGERVHKTAVIAKTAKLGANVILGPGVVVGENSVIGDNTFIGANAVIEANVKIGTDCKIHPQVYIGHTCTIGNRVEIKPNSTVGSDGYGYAHDAKGNHYRIPHYGPVIIEDDVHLGANVNVDRGTFDPAIIGAGTKVDNHVHIGHNNVIGKNCLITAGFISAGSAKIGDNCVFGGRSSVNGHVTIGSNCNFGGNSGVNNDTLEPGNYGGFPVVQFKEFLKYQATLVHLPKMRKNISRILKQLGLNEE